MNYIHAHLSNEEMEIVHILVKMTGKSVSEILRQALKFLYQKKNRHASSALDIVGKSTGKFRTSLKDISIDKKYLKGYGK